MYKIEEVYEKRGEFLKQKSRWYVSRLAGYTLFTKKPKWEFACGYYGHFSRWGKKEDFYTTKLSFETFEDAELWLNRYREELWLNRYGEELKKGETIIIE